MLSYFSILIPIIVVVRISTCDAKIQFTTDPEQVLTRKSRSVVEIHNLIVDHVLEQANKPIEFRMKNPVTPFIGRISELSELKWAQIDNKITVISGQRGVGKTELARKYALDFKHDNTSSTIWVDADTHESLITSFKDLAVILGIKLESKTITSLIREVFAHFGRRKTLIIFDNASDDNIFINNISQFKENTNFISIIITSRSENWKNNYHIIKLNLFTKEESMTYIKNTLQKSINLILDDPSSEKLLNALGYLPLTLNKATTFIIEKNLLFPTRIFTVDHYIDEFEKKDIFKEIRIIETVTTIRDPNEKEIEDFILDKIGDEAKSVGGKISHVAVEAWDKVSDGASTASHKISDIASDAGHEIAGFASRAGNRIAGAAESVGNKFKNVFG